MVRLVQILRTGRRLKALRLLGDDRAAAAAEFALVAPLLITMVMSVVDLGIYIFDSMQVSNAGQALAETIFAKCARTSPPVTTNCTALTTDAENTAVQSTSLGTQVTISGSLTEGWYCATGTGSPVTLHKEADTSQTTAGVCTEVAGETTKQGDYVSATVTYSYSPIFGGLSAASLLTGPITKTVWVRVN
jgi:Flp pilus assembly protein TadG